MGVVEGQLEHRRQDDQQGEHYYRPVAAPPPRGQPDSVVASAVAVLRVLSISPSLFLMHSWVMLVTSLGGITSCIDRQEETYRDGEDECCLDHLGHLVFPHCKMKFNFAFPLDRV